MNNSRLLQRYLQRLLMDDYILIRNIHVNTQTLEVSLFGNKPKETYTYDFKYDLLKISTIEGNPIAQAPISSKVFSGLPPLVIA